MIVERHIIREVIETTTKDSFHCPETYNYEEHPKWHWATRTFNVLRPLIGKQKTTKHIRQFYCAELGIGKTAFYKYLKILRETPYPSALLPKPKGQKKGTSRTFALSEKIMASVIREHYLTRQKKSIAACHKIVIRESHEAGIKEPPSLSTFGRRVRRVSKKNRLRRRNGRSFMLRENAPATTVFTADYPMQRVQIDHTTAVVSLVDTQWREAIGRPIVSFAIDHFTRVCTGFHVDLFGPNAENTSNVITHASFDKNDEAGKYSCEKHWPYLGLPETFHLDNGADFKSNAIRRGAAEHGIKLDYRPPGTPNYGGHIERFIGSINRHTELLPGTTFANIKERGNYDSEKHAVMTLSEYREYLFKYICDTYHHTPHKGLDGLTPFQKFQQAVDDGFIPRHPAKRQDEFWTDFIDHVPRTVRREGIEFERVFYWSQDIQAWYDQGLKSILVVPSRTDISRIQVIGPDKKLYTVFSKDHRIPNLTRSEYRKYRQKIALESRMGSLSNAEIARRVTDEHNIVQSAKRRTKSVRKTNEQRHLNNSNPTIEKPETDEALGDDFDVSRFLNGGEDE